MSARGRERTEKVIKTTVEMPEGLWMAVKSQAIVERSDLRAITIKALELYLRTVKKEGRR